MVGAVHKSERANTRWPALSPGLFIIYSGHGADTSNTSSSHLLPFRYRQGVNERKDVRAWLDDLLSWGNTSPYSCTELQCSELCKGRQVWLGLV